MKTLVKTFLLLLVPVFATAQNAECIKHLEKVKAELANSKADTNRVLLLTELCLGYLWYNSDSLEFYSKQGLELAKQLQFHKGDARILNCQGIFLAFHGNSPEALALLYKALRIAEESKLTFETANCLSSIGVSYWFLNDFTKSHDFINRAIKLDETVQHTPKDIYWRILIQVWSGIDNIRLNKLDSANIILKKAYDNAFNPEFTDLYSIRPTILMFSGEVQSKLGNKESAFSYLHQSIAYFIKNKDAIGAADACNNIAKVFKDVNQRDSVIYYSKLGLDAALKIDYKPTILRISKMLAEQYEGTDTKQANYYWKIVLAMNDSLYGAPKIQELQKTLFEEQRRQQLAQDLQTKRENQLKQYGFGAGLGVLCLIGLFLYRNNRQKQKANTKLQNTLGELQKAQTELENKNREAQIELSLEKVRSRSMAMHQSNELAAAASVLFQQIKDLGFEMWSCGFCIWKPDDFSELWMSADSGGLLPPMMMPYKEEPTHHKIYEDSLLGLPTHEYIWEGEELLKHYEFLYTIPSVKEAIDILKKSGLSLPLRQCYYVGYFKQGYLLIITKEPNTEMNNLSYRFTKVFEQTYTRFLDLQKAEAQARESQTQLALERVRARTMAMQHSTELNDTAALLFQQIKSLGIPPWSCGFNIWEQGDAVFNSYMAAPEGTILAENKIPLTEEATFIHFQESRDRGDELFVDVLEGEIIETHYNYFQTLPGIREMFEKRAAAGFPLPTFQINHLANFSHGNLMFITYEPCPEAHDIFIRFAKVFEQTYTRFLDLQKAEAQAREAQIEVALERVRSKTIAMHNSADVGESVAALFDELVKLGVKTNRCGILIHTDSEFSEVWTARSKPNEKATLVIGRLEINMHPMLVGIRTSWLNKESFYSYKLTGQDMINYYQAINNSKYYPTQFNLEALPAKEIHSDFHFSEGSVFAFTNEPLPTEWINVFKRFTSVFGQTYRRYLDLQKAEAQAREAQIEVALERVRSRAMAMQTSEELSIVIGSVYAELTKLDIELNRCFFMLFDPKTLEVTWWMASHEVGANSRGYKLPYHEHAPQLAYIKGWKERQEKWRYVAGGDDKKDWDEYIFAETELSQLPEFIISNMKSVKTINLSASFYHFGCLTTGTLEPLGEESFEILVRFAKVFDSTYTRFLDLQKAEAQAEQAKFDLIQIQTEKAKAEEALKILKATQNQLIQSEKLAGLGELTAGIAHEIQNPLNFVNNFAELSVDLAKDINSEIRKPEMDKEYLEELLTDLTHNQEKINLHGKRASSIVKGMLEHSRASTGVKELTDINKLCDEYFRLAYHGLRAKDKDFNCELISKFDEALPKIEIIPQDVGRVVLNLINNAFYAVNERANKKRSGNFESSPNVENLRGYKPMVTVTTQKTDNGIEIRVKDNGTGMPESVKEKIFQPFFTTKPTGSGTGLGLSLAYDIITKGHSGILKVESKEGEGSEFVIFLPILN